MCDGRKLQWSMCPPPVFDNKIQDVDAIHWWPTVTSETLWKFLPLGDCRSLQFFHRLELSLVVDSLLKSTPNGVIQGINIRAIWMPHVKFNDVDVLFFQIVHRGPGGVRWRSILLQCPPAMTTNCSDVRQQTLFEDDIAVVYELLTFAPGWMKTILVFHIRDTPTDTVTLRLKCKHLTPILAVVFVLLGDVVTQ